MRNESMAEGLAGRRVLRLPLGRPGVALWIALAISLVVGASARASCLVPSNEIEAENCLPGAPISSWDVVGAGDPTIQGFATETSVQAGDTIAFKVETPATEWSVEIYRLGWYQGLGARLVATLAPSATLPQVQPPCLSDSTGLIDCGNWAVSAVFDVPSASTSGVYLARFVRADTGGASHAPFVVRDDQSDSDLVVQTSDTSWQAYNTWGGNSLYVGNPPVGRAYKVSYNRPFNTRAVLGGNSWLMNAEYPMIRWLESNGYDVSYISAIDTHRDPSLLAAHRVFVSSGHDEYWSAEQRAGVEAAVGGGVHLAFFTGNTMFWKTRYEPSIDGSGTPLRTLVCYKETHAGVPIDPANPPTWTGTWRDARYSPPADGGRPENELIGTIFRINGLFIDRITVPQADGRMRFWRNTSIASLPFGGVAHLAPGTLGDEVDLDEDNGYRPPGLVRLSTRRVSTELLYLLDNGSTFGAGTGTHHLTLYRHASRALVFSSGTFQWAWGLDAVHDRSSVGPTTDVRMQQATVNLLADMETQPATLRPGLVAAAATSDGSPPTAGVGLPVDGFSTEVGSVVRASGSAYDDGGGVVGGVEVSIDGGVSWHPAEGRESWTYAFVPVVPGAIALRARAVDDSGNLGASPPARTINVGPCTRNCSLWAPDEIPSILDAGPDSPVELGFRFVADVAGAVTAVRFYKHPHNLGPHVANVWSSAGELLGSGTLPEDGVSGWRQVELAAPVAVSAGESYVASYFTASAHYSVDLGYFTATERIRAPLRSPASTPGARNGLFVYSPASAFPTQSFADASYGVDVVFTSEPSAELSAIEITPANAVVYVAARAHYSATGRYSDGALRDLTAKVVWSSSDALAAAIGGDGLLTALQGGATTVSATSGSVSGSTPLGVIDGPPTSECGDGIDNDLDGLADFPADAGCASSASPSREAPQCQDGLDNDQDGQVDHPSDALCIGPSDDDEASNPGTTCGLLGLEALPLLVVASKSRTRRRESTLL